MGKVVWCGIALLLLATLLVPERDDSPEQGEVPKMKVVDVALDCTIQFVEVFHITGTMEAKACRTLDSKRLTRKQYVRQAKAANDPRCRQMITVAGTGISDTLDPIVIEAWSRGCRKIVMTFVSCKFDRVSRETCAFLDESPPKQDASGGQSISYHWPPRVPVSQIFFSLTQGVEMPNLRTAD